ncbi:MAG: fused MFS/spermidine synthase [Methylococcaceae bacterium]
MTEFTVKTDHRLAPIVLFALTLFTSASLMFVLQPLFGKLLLPLLGGSPAVWNTCMVFYQSLLFLGYLYAHGLATRCTAKQQVFIHASIIALSFLVLPVALPDNNPPPTETNPTIWVFTTLLSAIGLPFFILSTTAPLMQKWFAQLNHKHSDDPYFLYVASNIGSLLSLLSYPFLLEPSIGLASQQTDWSIGYALLCLLLSSCALMLWFSAKNADNTHADIQENLPPLSIKTQMRWLALAFVPSSLLLGLTNFISTDIASVPLLWIIPLTVYLLSFVIVFSHWNDKSHPIILKLQPLFFVPFLICAFINPADLQYWAYLLLHIIAFFFAVMVCHGELAKARPHTAYLTRYYLIMSFAGMLGGMFNTFVAPFIFKGIYEYPLMIVAALLLRPSITAIHYRDKKLLWQIALPALVLSSGWLLFTAPQNPVDYFEAFAIALICLSLIAYWTRTQFIHYALFNGVIILLALGLHSLSAKTLYQERTFFGVLSVRESVLINEHNQPETYYELFHGTTKHGAERLTAENITTPLTYYSRPGPMGQLFNEYNKQNDAWTIGAVGLGAGALACYAKPSQNWTFYEIDPLVVSVAQNTHYFSYLKLCAPNATMRIGDARLSLNQEPEAKFDLLMLDAFSSDAVPTHLITQEALQLYFKKLKPNGILAFHITNRHLALKKVLSIHAEQLHKTAFIEEFKPQQELPLVVATDWVVMANNAQTLEPLKNSNLGVWETMPLYFDIKPWTDDFTNIVDIWKK